MSETHDAWLKAAFGLDVARNLDRVARESDSPVSPDDDTGVGPDIPMQPVAIGSTRGNGTAGGDDIESQKKKLSEEFAGLSAKLNQVIDRANPKNKQDLLALAATFAARQKSDDILNLQGAMEDLKSRLSEVMASHEAQDKARAARGGRMATLSRNIQKLMNELA